MTSEARTSSQKTKMVGRQSPGEIDKISELLTGKETIKLLGIKPQTLYAYVSRGWIRSVPHGSKRFKLYSREDAEQMRARGHARLGKSTAEGALRWGEPSIHTSITNITLQGPRYRNRLAVDLARSHATFESVAELLWSGTWLDEAHIWDSEPPPAGLDRILDAFVNLHPPAQLIPIFSVLVMSMGIAENGYDEIKQGTTILRARRLIGSLTGCCGYLSQLKYYVPLKNGESIASGLARSVGIEVSDETLAMLNAALIVSADHEFTPPTFAARVAASSGAGLYSCIVAALSTHTGTRVRKACDKVEDLLTTTRGKSEFRKRLAPLCRAANMLPGFNHPLYPDGDPRATYLIELAKSRSRQTKQSETIYELLDQAAREFNAKPSIEAGLVTLCHGLGMPPRSAGGLLALARTVGWIAHVLEQRLAGVMLRPKARYVPLE